MKNFINKICAWLIGRGSDKWLHLLFGIIIAELIMLIPLPISGRIVLAIWFAGIVDLFKELKLDACVDFYDLLYTIVGSIIGSALSCLTIICL